VTGDVEVVAFTAAISTTVLQLYLFVLN